MRNRFDQIGKKVLRGALELGGTVATQLEIPSADAQAVDTWFEPAPGHEASLERAGVLGRMASGPTMFETFSDTPSVDDVRGCLRKQLALDHSRVLEAQRQALPRPSFPALSCISSGRPESVLHGYGLTPKPSFPPGFYEASEAWAVGVVVLRELPRDRSTLLLRLLGAGAVLKDAVEDLARLPEDAWERQVAMPALLCGPRGRADPRQASAAGRSSADIVGMTGWVPSLRQPFSVRLVFIEMACSFLTSARSLSRPDACLFFNRAQGRTPRARQARPRPCPPRPPRNQRRKST